MCGRFSLIGETLDKQSLDELHELIGSEPTFGNDYNISPSNRPAVIRMLDGKPQLANLTWNFRPEWMKNKNDAQFNARAENVFSTRMFKTSAAGRRCLVPATGWYEWQKVTGGTRPHSFRMVGQPLILFAGIWTRWTDGQETDDSFAIITTDANAVSAPVHNRMPVILTGADRRTWLTETVSEPEDVYRLQDLLRPYAGTDLEPFAVNPYVGNPRNKGPQCLEPDNRLL